MKNLKALLTFAILASSVVAQAEPIQSMDFDLAQLKVKKPVMKIVRRMKDDNGNYTNEPAYIYALENRHPTQNMSMIGPRIQTGNEPRIMGLTAQEAQLASRDGFNMRACSPGHEQGDLANRWCHSVVSQSVVSAIFGENGNPILKAVGESLFWAPKEFFMDMNPSAHDLTFTYRDTLGSRRSLFEVTVFGDAIFDNHMDKVKPFSGSTPFLTWKRQLGPRSRD